MTFADAVKDAAEARPDEISTTLVAILPGTPGLVWRTRDKTERVLMAQWVADTAYGDVIGGAVSLTQEAWVTPAPFVADFCKSARVEGAALTARLEQLLGLPPKSGRERFVELWVDPKDMFRPCADPEITDHECGLSYPEPGALVTVSPEHVRWFQDTKSRAYSEGMSSWTRLGYTFDWAGPEVGMSELVIKKGATVIVEKVAPTEQYCR
jgi:hypothetical protein